MKYSIQAKQISFAYNQQKVLKGLNLNVPKGSIYGFLGKNGAGKSTTIKLMLGLLNCQEGDFVVNGSSIRSEREQVLNSVGCLIESPAFYQKFTAYENLKYNNFYYKDCDEKRIDELLELVDLSASRNKKVNKFSTGMYQRLGIARALLNNPEILILDEPLNGLDPDGIHLIRKLILELQAQGKTIFLSSHILDEVEKTCTHVGIIDEGELRHEGELKHLLLQQQQVLLTTSETDMRRVEELANTHQFTYRQVSPTEAQIGVTDEQEHHKLIYLLVQEGIHIYNITSTRNHLEDLFLSMTHLAK